MNENSKKDEEILSFEDIDGYLPLYISEDGQIWLKTNVISYSWPGSIDDNPDIIRRTLN